VSPEWWTYAVFFLLGVIVSFINSIAGGGSSLSLPIMIFLGLPPTVANGTNRIGIFIGNISSALHLARGGNLDKKVLKQLILPTLLGAVLGMFLIVRLNDELLKLLIALAICMVTVFSNLKPTVLGKPREKPPEKLSPGGFFLFLGTALYGCVLQIGVGFMQIFALSRYTGLDLIRVNALKTALTTIFLSLSTIALAIHGKVQWGLGITMAVGATLGGYLGSKIQQKRGKTFVRRFIGIASIGLALYLIYDVIF
jgi:uncharacterized membrane protein YfcA